MLFHELVQNGDGVQVPADHLVPLRVQAPGGDFQILSNNELVGKAVFQHVGVVIRVVIAENQGLFPLGKIEIIGFHPRDAVVAVFTPDAVDVHQDIALFIDALEDFVVLVHRDHEIVQAVGLAVPVKGQLRIGDDRVEEQMLHPAPPENIPLPLLCGVLDFIGFLHRGGGRLRLLELRLRRRRFLLRRGGGGAGGQEEKQENKAEYSAHSVGSFLSKNQ